MSIIDPILMEMEEEAKRTRRVLERVPEDKLPWKPHPKSFSLGQLAIHIAAAQGRIAQAAAKDIHHIVLTEPPEPKSRKEILDAFDESQTTAKNTLRNMDDARLMATWTGQLEGKTIVSIPRIAFIRAIMLNHIYHHRGQLSVYLRLLDVAVPSIYGPSADEKPIPITTTAAA
jgi:uncharacterized damage-inducible protein DinB